RKVHAVEPAASRRHGLGLGVVDPDVAVRRIAGDLRRQRYRRVADQAPQSPPHLAATAMNLPRRHVLQLGAAASLAGSLPFAARAQQPGPERADHIIRIATGLVELGANTIVSTKLYNG